MNTTPDPKVIRNRFQRSQLPRNWDIAEALRSGATTLDELAALYGVKPRSIQKRLFIGGWDASGHPIPPWQGRDVPPGMHVCRRCGREREVKKGHANELCFDCTQVEADLAEMEGAA